MRTTITILGMLALTACGKDECTDEPDVTVEICDDGADNDGDGFTDCADQDCADGCVEDCADGVDNDGDGVTDCADDDCDGECPEDCFDGRDNDGDGATDCADDDCDGQRCTEVCDDGRDNDGDGLVDCEDAECAEGCGEITCDDGVDDDHDGLVDCDDDDCWGNGCEVTIATRTDGTVDGDIEYMTAYITGSNSTYGDVWARQHYGSIRLYGTALGTVRAQSAGGAWNTCAWSADLSLDLDSTTMIASVEYGDFNGIFMDSHEGGIQRYTQVSSGCAVPLGPFLPQVFTVGEGALSHPDGVWYAPAWTTSTTTTRSESSSAGLWRDTHYGSFRGSSVGLGTAVPYAVGRAPAAP